MKPADDHGHLSEDQIDLIMNFEADYNAIDRFLRQSLDCDMNGSFINLVRQYSDDHKGWHDDKFLKMIADVRNAIVHWKTKPYRYVAVPTPEISRRLRDCRHGLENPVRAIQKFMRGVEGVSLGDSLTKVLKIVRERDYSQFPVFENGRFQGLLTENGITRWLAKHATTECSLIELNDETVEQVLQNEGKRRNYDFVAQDVRVDDVSSSFASHELLEAVFITNKGKETEKLLGIATRWDIIHLADC